MSEAKHTPGPWAVVPADKAEHRWIVGDAEGGSIASCEPMGPWMSAEEADANARLISAAPECLSVAKNAAATIGAIYEWLERVEAKGGATNIEGVAACHAMLTSLRKNAARTEARIMVPLRAAIAKSEART